MSVKKVIKKIPGVQSLVNIKKATSFRQDGKYYLQYGYNFDRKTEESVEFKIVTELHKLEKGFGAKEKRPFGAKKVAFIIGLLADCKKQYGSTPAFATNLVISAFEKYKQLFEKEGWTNYPQYEQVKEFLAQQKKSSSLPFGSEEWEYDAKKILTAAEYEKFMKSRRSTRAFSDTPVTEKEIEKAVKMAQHSPSACNRQPVKVYFVKSKGNKQLLTNILPGLTLFEMDNVNLLLVTFDMSFVLFPGERNQGWFNAGLFSMNLVNSLHSMGIGTCFLQYAETMATERDMKAKMGIPDNERVAVAIACGHYKKTNIALASARKPVKDVFKTL